LLFNHTNFQCFSKVNTDVNTFDCTIYEAYWSKKTIRYYLRFPLIVFWEYGAFHSGNARKRRFKKKLR
jgi:hypothetical protein